MTKTPRQSTLDQTYKDEATLLRKVKEWLEPQERYGIKVLRINDRYAKGYADLFVCVGGWFVILELKDDTGTTSPHQDLFIKEMRDAGAVGGVCRSVDDVRKYINEATKLARHGRIW